MKLIIDIPDYDYRQIKECYEKNDTVEATYSYIYHGTSLPKGHGRLIDADEAIKTLESLGNRDYRREKGTIQEAVKMLRYDDYTPTVIEAESEG